MNKNVPQDANQLNQPKNIIAALLILFIFVYMVYFVYTTMPVGVESAINESPPMGVDWKGVYQKAALGLLEGKSPYEGQNFYNPPWVLLPLIPIALFPPPLGTSIMYVLNLFLFLFVMIKLETNIWLAIPFVFLSGMAINSNNGNIEGFVALGFILPPQIGLFFILSKPQIGIAVAFFWMVEAWRTGGYKEVIRVFLPVTIAFLLSFLLFGPWLFNSTRIIDIWVNASIWPKGIPIGIFLLTLAIWRREIKFAIAASPFFAPYLAPHTWAFVWLGLLALIPQKIDFRALLRKLTPRG